MTQGRSDRSREDKNLQFLLVTKFRPVCWPAHARRIHSALNKDHPNTLAKSGSVLSLDSAETKAVPKLV